MLTIYERDRVPRVLTTGMGLQCNLPSVSISDIGLATVRALGK
jgi:hypothetical protein